MAKQPLCHIITPVGMLGYGFDEALTASELVRLVPTGVPTAIILDSGSTDSGPEKLALGGMSCPRSAYLKDLTKMLRLVHIFRVPLIFASAGGDGSDEHVKVMMEIMDEIMAENENQGHSIKATSIFSGIPKATILERLQAGRVSPCGPCVPALTEDKIDDSPRIVAQIGPEPFVDAMEADPDFNVIIGGRAYDPATYVAFCIFQLKRQFPDVSSSDIHTRLGGFYHMGKIMECGGQCSFPKSHGAISTIYPSGEFDVRPLAPEARCSPYSVAAHVLYENTRPDFLRGPGGKLDLTRSQYEQLDERTVRVSGSQYISSRSEGLPYCLKLEAGRMVGYRSMFLGSVRDHILISQLDKLLGKVRWYVGEQFPDLAGQWELDFHIYGQGQTAGSGPGEVFIIAEVLAPTQQIATSLASKARVAMIHGAYPGQKASAGNFAFGIGGKLDIEMGPCAEFSVYHLMELNRGEERLASDPVSSGNNDKLIHSSINVYGQGELLMSDPEFIASVARLQEVYPIPAAKPVSRGDSAPVPVKNPKTLSDVCRVLRSKNAGPFEITLDAIFFTEAAYQSVKASGLLSKSRVAKALGVAEKDIIWMGFFEPALAFKVTIPRYRAGKMRSAGGFMENDVHGSQQHMGFANIKLSGADAGQSTEHRITSLLKPLWGGQSWYRMAAVVSALWSVSAWAAAKHVVSRQKSG